MTPTPLHEVTDESRFGGKAVSLGAAVRAGLPVPPGVALSVDLVAAVAAGSVDAHGAVLRCPALPAGPVAVRSSAVGEDSETASFAGQHVTRLNVLPSQILAAVHDVWTSAHTESARAYRLRHGVTGEPAIGVVIQMLVAPLAAGVMFTRNPMTGAEERVIEAAWGLGEAVVSGRVTPDFYRLAPDGRLLEQMAGDKDVEIVGHDGHGVLERAVEESRRGAWCLAASHLRQLHDLASRCQRVGGVALDIEWALGRDGAVYLLQTRPITTGRTGPA